MSQPKCLFQLLLASQNPQGPAPDRARGGGRVRPPGWDLLVIRKVPVWLDFEILTSRGPLRSDLKMGHLPPGFHGGGVDLGGHHLGIKQRCAPFQNGRGYKDLTDRS